MRGKEERRRRRWREEREKKENELWRLIMSCSEADHSLQLQTGHLKHFTKQEWLFPLLRSDGKAKDRGQFYVIFYI